jgi:hypothetical protein
MRYRSGALQLARHRVAAELPERRSGLGMREISSSQQTYEHNTCAGQRFGPANVGNRDLKRDANYSRVSKGAEVVCEEGQQDRATTGTLRGEMTCQSRSYCMATFCASSATISLRGMSTRRTKLAVKGMTGMSWPVFILRKRPLEMCSVTT